MRQDKSETFIENGAFYITTRKQLLDSKLRYSGKIGVVEMPLSRSFQIDTMEDLELIRSLKI
jgi:N-acylneuraminate cytidylyltransferase